MPPWIVTAWFLLREILTTSIAVSYLQPAICRSATFKQLLQKINSEIRPVGEMALALIAAIDEYYRSYTVASIFELRSAGDLGSPKTYLKWNGKDLQRGAGS